MENKKILINM